MFRTGGRALLRGVDQIFGGLEMSLARSAISRPMDSGHGASRALQKKDAQKIFEFQDPGAERRLRHGAGLRGAAEIRARRRRSGSAVAGAWEAFSCLVIYLQLR